MVEENAEVPHVTQASPEVVTQVTMNDPSASGDLELPWPVRKTAREILERGPVTLLATPTVDGETADEAPPSTGSSSPSPEESGSSADGEGAGDEAEFPEWMMVPSAPRTDRTTELWHYTDARGAIAIVESGVLWASSVTALNDSSEYQHGRELLEGILREVEDTRRLHPFQKAHIRQVVRTSDEIVEDSGLFVLCASRAGHSLAQWRAYGGSMGHAIVLDSSSPLAVISDEDRNYTVDSIFHTWRDVLYGAEEKRRLLLEVLGYIAAVTPADGSVPKQEEIRSSATTLIGAIGHCKEESFSEEQEARYLVQASDPSCLKFRSAATGIVAYVDVSSADHGAQRARARSHVLRLPIKRFVVGPFGSRNESAQGARVLLGARGYPDVEIDVSRSTLR